MAGFRVEAAELDQFGIRPPFQTESEVRGPFGVADCSAAVPPIQPFFTRIYCAVDAFASPTEKSVDVLRAFHVLSDSSFSRPLFSAAA